MSEQTIRLRRREPNGGLRNRQGLSDRCWTCWLLALLILTLLFVSTANTIMLWNMSQHVKVVKVERAE